MAVAIGHDVSHVAQLATVIIGLNKAVTKMTALAYFLTIPPRPMLLRHDDFQLIAVPLPQTRSRFGADGQPINIGWCEQSAVGFGGNKELFLVKGIR